VSEAVIVYVTMRKLAGRELDEKTRGFRARWGWRKVNMESVITNLSRVVRTRAPNFGGKS